MSPPTAWWSGDLRERFWLESTDRTDLGADLRAPLVDNSGADNWRYTLFQQASVGDLVFHYDKRRAAITSFSTISGAPTPGPIVWAARGSYARERSAEPAELAGYRMSLHEHRSLTEPVTLEALRAASSSIRALHDRLKARVGGPLYFPFELSGRPIRPLQGYAFKLPADFVDSFDVLREVAGLISTVPPARAEEAERASSRQAIVARSDPAMARQSGLERASIRTGTGSRGLKMIAAPRQDDKGHRDAARQSG